jgi:hypothetical protein
MRSHRALHKLDIFHRSCVYRRFLHGIYSCYTVWSLDCYNRRTVPYLHWSIHCYNFAMFTQKPRSRSACVCCLDLSSIAVDLSDITMDDI